MAFPTTPAAYLGDGADSRGKIYLNASGGHSLKGSDSDTPERIPSQMHTGRGTLFTHTLASVFDFHGHSTCSPWFDGGALRGLRKRDTSRAGYRLLNMHCRWTLPEKKGHQVLENASCVCNPHIALRLRLLCINHLRTSLTECCRILHHSFCESRHRRNDDRGLTFITMFSPQA